MFIDIGLPPGEVIFDQVACTLIGIIGDDIEQNCKHLKNWVA
jgi:hypothetical protein